MEEIVPLGNAEGTLQQLCPLVGNYVWVSLVVGLHPGQGDAAEELAEEVKARVDEAQNEHEVECLAGRMVFLFVNIHVRGGVQMF